MTRSRDKKQDIYFVMQINLKIWRQQDSQSKGRLEVYSVNDAHPSMSFIELLDLLNEQLSKALAHQLPLIAIAVRGFAVLVA